MKKNMETTKGVQGLGLIGVRGNVEENGNYCIMENPMEKKMDNYLESGFVRSM